MADAKILVVDDEQAFLTLLRYQLSKLGYEVCTAATGRSALDMAAAEKPDLVLLDVMLPDLDGIEVLRQLKQSFPALPVIMMTAAYVGGHGVEDGMTSIQKAVEALTLGAYDYTLKPANEFIDKVKISVQNALRERQAVSKVAQLREQLIETAAAFANIIGDSPEMLRVFQMTEKVLDSNATVLLLGESGTGKELLARAIHYNSPRAKGPLVILNCAAIPETLLESELFGHEKGTFTGATGLKIGKFEQADGGTLFLDEIGDMTLNTQAKVLRALQEKEITRVGGTKRILVNVRVIAATNKNLETEMQAGRFREDLYYRLSVYPIRIPPLRNRKSDLPLLAGHFLHKYTQEMGKSLSGFTDEAMRLIMAYDWPGNVRELENAIHRAIILTSGPSITPDDLPPELQALQPVRRLPVEDLPLVEAPDAPAPGPKGFPNPPGPKAEVEEAEVIPLEVLEEQALRRALEINQGNVAKAARQLGIGRTTFYRKAQKFGLELEESE